MPGGGRGREPLEPPIPVVCDGAESIRDEYGLLGEICVHSLRCESQQTRGSLVEATAAASLRSVSVARPLNPPPDCALQDS